MKILIVSDTHDNYKRFANAVDAGNAAGCEVMLHAGDFVSPPTLEVLEDFKGKVYLVWGNNEGEKIGFMKRIEKMSNVEHCGDVMEKEIDRLKFYMNHFPDIVENAALSGKYDVCVYGHTHLYDKRTLENGTLVLNPGEVHGNKTGVPTCMIFDTATKTVERKLL